MADAATSTSGSQLPRKRNRKPKSASSDAIQAEKGATSEVKPKKNEKERQKERLKSNALKRRKQDEELTVLQKSVDEFVSLGWHRRTIPTAQTLILHALGWQVPPSIIDAFSLLPLSSRTLLGLKSSHFTTPTPIQALSLPASLKNNDILGSARTGSGKTLAFLIPVLERLYRERWGPMDGLGAVVISPTRELVSDSKTLSNLHRDG